MRVLITGATGLIGRELVKLCHEQGIAVNYLSTKKYGLASIDNYQGFYWNPASGEIDNNCFKDVEVVINLAGAAIAKRWTTGYKEKILNSRVQSVKLLLHSIKQNKIEIKQLISASAIGVYPDSLTNYYGEEYETRGDDFLSEVGKKWEAAVDEFSDLDIIVSKVRIGVVLSNKGGALPKLAEPIKYFAGSCLGSGKQWQSWIHIKDLTALFLHVIKYNLSGVYNAVAPNPVMQRELIKEIAEVMNKPLILPNVPALTLKLILGEMSDLVLKGQRVSAKKIQDKGFIFSFPNLKPALEDLLNKN